GWLFAASRAHPITTLTLSGRTTNCLSRPVLARCMRMTAIALVRLYIATNKAAGRRRILPPPGYWRVWLCDFSQKQAGQLTLRSFKAFYRHYLLYGLATAQARCQIPIHILMRLDRLLSNYFNVRAATGCR